MRIVYLSVSVDIGMFVQIQNKHKQIVVLVKYLFSNKRKTLQ